MTETIETADSIRTKMLAVFEEFKPQLEAYHKYAETIAAHSLEYHKRRFLEAYPDVPLEELTLAVSLDCRETPKSLDVKLAQLVANKVMVKRIIYDATKATFFVFI